jgi:hypothetical protein
MYPRIALITAAAGGLVLCQVAPDRVQATVVRDGKNGPFNPAVEVGGHGLLSQANNPPLIVVPYGLSDPLRIAYQWFPPFSAWPWDGPSLFNWHCPGGQVRGAGTLIIRPRRWTR